MSATTFLRFSDELEFLALLPADFVLAGETSVPLPAGVEAISIVGAIDALPGFHVNLLGTCPPEWAAYRSNPHHP